MTPSVQADTSQRVWLAEHGQIYDQFQRISRAAERLREHGASTRRLKLMAEEIDALRKKLETHFHREEKAQGLFDVIASVLPDDKRRLDAFRAEHVEVSELLDALHGRVIGKGKIDVKQLATETATLVSKLYDHETAEERLAERALSWKAPKR